jgi:predicted TIM-barrel fold metal-dependent hydrolase
VNDHHPVVDGDQHLFEPRTMWRDHIDPAFRDDALAIEDDDLGYPWLTWRDRRLYLAEVQHPGNAVEIGDLRGRIAAGRPAEVPYDEALPPSYTDPLARVKALDGFGLDAAVVLPNFGLLWEDMLSADLPALCANLRAHNRWMAESAGASNGRLHGVAHLTMRDRAWAVEEIARIRQDGLRLAMVAPGTVDGVAPSHRALDPIWAAFEDHGVAPVFHVGGFRKPFEPAWYEGDPEPVDRILDSIFLHVPAALALANLILMGTLERHPDLRIGVIELTASWVPMFLATMDGALHFYSARHDGPPRPLERSPSEYFRRQVRVGVLGYEQPGTLIRQAGEELFMFGSDWPHAEGLPEPRASYEGFIDDVEGPARHRLMGDNVRWLLGEAG